MPKLADTLVEGTLGQWLKAAGDAISQGEPLATIETDKVTTELTSPASGTLLELLVDAGQTVPVETPLARIGVAVDTAVPPSRKPTPVAARLLAEHGLTPEQIPTRSIRLKRDDVLAFVQQRGASPPPARDRELMPLTQMRRAIADHMTRARQTIPHGQTVMDADLSRVVAWRDANRSGFQRQEGASLTFTVLFVQALARQLAGFERESVDIGVAVALDAGLIVPVLRQADRLSLGETARGIADLASRARASQLQPDELQGARMTVTNVGSFGNVTASPIVPLGQLGILGPGLVEQQVLPGADGGIRAGWRCLLSLVFDRREMDDYAADRFLRGVIDELTRIPG